MPIKRGRGKEFQDEVASNSKTTPIPKLFAEKFVADKRELCPQRLLNEHACFYIDGLGHL
jgi:hypothetical protein